MAFFDRIEVIADDREAESGIVESLRAMRGVSVAVRRLRLGDYLVDGRLLFERKTVDDLVESIVDGRLRSQGVRLATARYRAVVVLEGGRVRSPAPACAARRFRDATHRVLRFWRLNWQCSMNCRR